jgi:hypothetical protein
MIVRARHTPRRDADGHLVVPVLGDENRPELRRVSELEAAKVQTAFAQSQFDLERYARMDAIFPAPDSIPVEL